MEFDFGDDLPPDPCLQAAQLKYALSHNYVSGSARAVSLSELRKLLEENNLYYLATLCEQTIPDLKLGTAKLDALRKTKEAKKEALDKELKDAEDNFGEVEVMEVHRKLSEFYYATDSKERALEEFELVSKLKGMSTGQLLDNGLKKVLLGLLWMDSELVERAVEECDRLLEVGGDWERRNRLAVYRGFFEMINRQFDKASKSFLSVLATFTCTEVCDYTQFVFYAVLCSMISLDRVELKQKVVDSAQVKAVYEQVDYFPQFVCSLHDADYSTFLCSVVGLYPKIESDRYVGQHAKWLLRELRVKAYAQFLQSFKSVTLDLMSYDFQLSKQLLDKELSRFIASGRLKAKIDKKQGVVESFTAASNTSVASVKYGEVIKQGDLLLNKVQQLSRLLGV